MDYLGKLNAVLAQQDKTYWSGRIAAQLVYADRLSATQEDAFRREIENVLDVLLASMESDGVITDSAAQFAEKLLSPLSEAAKKLTLLCIGHAHIDMNWQWGFHETASVTVDTFRTMLTLMEEYPSFTFAQSQASTYQIIEEYAPWMLDDIRKRVAEGRWEVTASTWVEPDKNMPSGESLARHILMTKRYLSNLIPAVKPENLTIDFEPDTFGHSANIPEICSAGGIRYYYHCRGNGDHNIYRWRSLSGAEVLVYREPVWYNGKIHARMADIVPDFCKLYRTDCMLKVYGVGDHGGGPTRRDLERMIDMASWPVMPEIRFGTFGEFFRRIDIPENDYPVLTGEQNFLFTGCYTSQSRIKMANRLGEDRLYDAELLAAAAQLAGGESMAASFDKAWQNILFNHFHDILPGSGVTETREYAMGMFQRSMAAVKINANRAMQTIAEQLNTSSIPFDDDRQSASEGGGAGYGSAESAHYVLTGASRGRGKTRAVTLFNTTMYPWRGAVTLTVWDWPGDSARVSVRCPDGTRLPVQVMETGTWYWDHRFMRLAVDADIPALGYATLIVEELPPAPVRFTPNAPDRLEDFSDASIVLENDCVRAEFDRRTMKCTALTDLRTRRSLVPRDGSCFFRLIDEDTVNGMTSWRVGGTMRAIDLNETEPVRVERVHKGAVEQTVFYRMAFRGSKLEVTVRLAAHSPVLEYAVKADFREAGTRESVPQLAFAVPLGYHAKSFVNDIPMAVIERGALAHDVPCRSFTLAKNEGRNEANPSVLLTTDSKYGFRNGEEELAVALIRGSTDPDPTPEYGMHHIRIGVAVVTEPTYDACVRLATQFAHPCPSVSVPLGQPSAEKRLPLSGSLCRLEGDGVCLSAVKPAEDGSGIVLRVYNAAPTETKCRISFRVKPKAAYTCNLNETGLAPLAFNGKQLELTLPPHGLRTVKLLPETAR